MKRGIGKSFVRKSLMFVAICFIGMLCGEYKAEASLWDNPYVTFSPDGNAFTINAGDLDTEWYEYGKIINTGNISTLSDPEAGEHLYSVIVTDNVRVGKWMVEHMPARCIHSFITDISDFHGVTFGKDVCYREYYSGWRAYCADCNQKVVDGYFYMSDEAAASMKEIDMSLAYYYQCPRCTHLEQGYELKQHVCKDISANQYSVRYNANFGKGYMPKSIHMYNNATKYEGKEITPQKNLTLNSYTRVGYEFAGWNTEIDGTGKSFRDGEEILNLCTEEQDSIILYAQWKKSQSVLQIDPNGGLYNGSDEVCKIPGTYGSNYQLAPDDVKPPSGAVVHFESNGGNAIADIKGLMEFSEWSFKQPFHGVLKDNVYTYKGKDGAIDYATAVYRYKPVILPECQKEGYSFGGWYFDKEGTKIAGTAGDEFLTTEDITLYAYWVELQLESEDNYFVNGGKGAVNLYWEQSDSREKTYLLYQKQDGTEWKEIHSADDISVGKYIKKEIQYTGQESNYTIPYTGYYRLTLCGAQGENYESFLGGRGGMVTAVIYFEKGEKLNYIIGGQNGYNGGGIGTIYGNGGGYTSVASPDKGVFLIAGGGGGATSLNDGQAGGSLLGNVEGQQGQEGMAGGGGGYHGGMSGSAVLHSHTDSCSHEHIGDPCTYGECYTVKQVCGNSSFTKTKYQDIFYYGNRDADGNRIYCVRCGSYECPGHHDVKYRYQCKVCGEKYKDKKPTACTAYKYGLGCDKEEGYICGYEDGEVIGSTASYGGSNYIKTEECLTYEEESDVNEGNGVLLLEAVHVGFIEDNHLTGVNAIDNAAPDKISLDTVEIKAIDENKVNVVFERPTDRGTVYYHMAESYDRNTNQKISTSNQTVNVLKSGISGYRYRLDGYENTVVTEQDSCYLDTGTMPYIGVVISEQTQYLHIAAMDKAGNLSETVHIPLSSREIIFWPVVTEQMVIREDENVYKTGDDYYVKADGTTPFTVSFNSRLCGTALKDYQINQLCFLSRNSTSGQNDGRLKLITPVESIVAAGTNIYRGEAIRKQYENTFLLTDSSFTEIRRSNYCKDMKITQTFSMSEELDGSRISLTPQAGVYINNVNIFSDKSMDLENSIYLIADGKGPDIAGLNIPDGIVNTKEGKWEYLLQIEARDFGSGMKEFWLEVRNADNGGYERIDDSDGDGIISLKLSPEDPIFSGQFTLIAVARDNVGNESVMTYGLDGITINAYVEKVLDGQNEFFQKGESGKLHIQTTGYIEKVDVIFPLEWSEQNSALNRVYTYDVPDFMRTEELEFIVPLQVPDGDYTIMVKAHKGDMTVEANPELITIAVSGSVLDEIRTRLR